MADYTIKRRDKGTVLEMVLEEWDAAQGLWVPIDLSGVTEAKLQMKATGATVWGVGAVDLATLGRVTYTWALGDLTYEGDYQAEVQLTRTDGSIETVPNAGWFEIAVVADLDPTVL